MLNLSLYCKNWIFFSPEANIVGLVRHVVLMSLTPACNSHVTIKRATGTKKY